MFSLKTLVKNHSFLFLTILFYIVLQRMDVLFFYPRSPSYNCMMTWWIFMPIMIIVISTIIYTVGRNTWKSLFFFLCYPAMLLDFLYILSVPIPSFWLDTSFIWFWHPAYVFFQYPWTIKEQIFHWSISFILLGILYVKKVIKEREKV